MPLDKLVLPGGTSQRSTDGGPLTRMHMSVTFCPYSKVEPPDANISVEIECKTYSYPGVLLMAALTVSSG